MGPKKTENLNGCRTVTLQIDHFYRENFLYMPMLWHVRALLSCTMKYESPIILSPPWHLWACVWAWMGFSQGISLSSWPLQNSPQSLCGWSSHSVGPASGWKDAWWGINTNMLMLRSFTWLMSIYQQQTWKTEFLSNVSNELENVRTHIITRWACTK